MAPDQRGQVGNVVVVDIHALLPDVANGFLHVDGVPAHNGRSRAANTNPTAAISAHGRRMPISHEWTMQHRYMQVEGMAELIAPAETKIPRSP